MTTPALVLASASPRRRELLASAGLDFVVAPAPIDESRRHGEPPLAYVRRMAREKAAAALAGQALGDRVVLAADTIVTRDDEVFGKPGSAEDAHATLRALSGGTHAVMTSVAVRTAQRTLVRVVRTRVTFRPLTAADIARYLATGEAWDKAGAYGFQGHGGALVARIVGSPTNVIGLPLPETLVLLTAVGIPKETSR